MSTQEKGFDEVEAPNTSKTFPSLLAGIGASGAVLAAAATGFVFLLGAVSFDVWPHARPALEGATGELRAPLTVKPEDSGSSSAPAPDLTASAAPSSGPAPVTVAGSVAPTAPPSSSAKLGNSGLAAEPAPSPGGGGQGEGGGSPGGGGGGEGGSGIAEGEEGPPLDVSRPIYGPSTGSDASSADDDEGSGDRDPHDHGDHGVGSGRDRH